MREWSDLHLDAAPSHGQPDVVVCAYRRVHFDAFVRVCVRRILFCNGAHSVGVVCAYHRVRVDAFVRVGVYARVEKHWRTLRWRRVREGCKRSVAAHGSGGRTCSAANVKTGGLSTKH